MARPKKEIAVADVALEGEVLSAGEIIPLDPAIVAANMPAPPPAPVFSELARRLAGLFGANLFHEDESTITLEKNGYPLSVNWHQPEESIESAFRRGLPK